MNPNKAVKRLTEEVIEELNLPYQLSYNVINIRLKWALGIGFDIGRQSRSKSKLIASLDSNNRIINVYPSLRAAARTMDAASANISRAIYKKKTCAGLKWKFVNPDDYFTYRKIDKL